jgi:outer membrane protein assembly factor BamE
MICLSGLFAALSACSSLPSLDSLPSVAGEKVLGLVTPYRVEVVQGNVLTKELVARVKPGMSRAQVRDLLGSPLLTDIFHDDRWDYSFSIRRQGAPYQQRQVVAMFDGDKLKSLTVPDDLPTENEFVAAITTFKPTGNPPKLALTDDERRALPVPVRAAAPTAVEGIGPLRSYPPLEARTEPRT